MASHDRPVQRRPRPAGSSDAQTSVQPAMPVSSHDAVLDGGSHDTLGNAELAGTDTMGPAVLARGLQLLARMGVHCPPLSARANSDVLALMRDGDPVLAAACRAAHGVATEGDQAMLSRLRAGDRPLPEIPVGGGRPMPAQVRAPFETAMGRDFSDVRIHTDVTAAPQMGAMAFAMGSDVYFAPGLYSPGSFEGDRLIAHELVHVGQHQDGRIPSGGGMSSPSDPLEREAYGAEHQLAVDVRSLRAEPAPGSSDGLELGLESSVEGAGEAAPSLLSEQTAEEGSTDESAGVGPTGPEVPDDVIFAEADAVVDEEVVEEPAEEEGQVSDPEPEGSASDGAPAESQGPEEAPAEAAAPAPVPTEALPPIAIEVEEVAVQEAAAMGPAPERSVPAAGAAHQGTVDSAVAAVHAQATTALSTSQQAIRAHATSLAAQADAAVAAARSQVDAAFDAQAAAITAAAASVQSQVSAAIESTLAQITAAHAAQQAVIEADRAARHADVDAQIAQTRERMVAFGETEAERARQGTAERIAQVQGLAGTAGAGGDSQSADAQRQAAERIVEKVVTELEAKGESLAEGATQAATDAASQLDGTATATHTEIDTQVDDAIVQLESMRAATEQAVAEQATGVTEQITAVQTVSIEVLETQRTTIHGDLDEMARHVRATLTESAEQLVVPLAEQVTAALAEVDAQAAIAVADLVTIADEDEAASYAQQVASEVAGAGGDIVSALSAAQAASIGELDQMRAQVDVTLQSVVAGATDAASAAATAATERLNQAAAATLEGLQQTAEQTNQALQGLVTELQGQLDEVSATLATDLDGQATAVESELTETVDAGLAEEDEQVSHTASSIADAQSEIAGEYDRLKSGTEAQAPSQRIQRGFWSDLGNAVKDVVSAVANWFMDSFLPWLGGAILGFLVTALILVVAAVVVVALIAAGPWGWAALAVLAIGMIAMMINGRYQEWVADIGQPGFWGWVGIVGLSILDLTGIPFLLEGLFGRRITGGELDPFDAGWRFGTGAASLLGMFLAVRARFRGRGPKGPAEEGAGTRPVEDGAGTRPAEDGAGTRPAEEGGGRSEDGSGRTEDGPGRTEDGLPPDPEARQQRLEELSRDHDHNGRVTENSKVEAEMALDLEESGRLPEPVRRPGHGESGDIVDGDGVQWDFKRPRSRDVLQEQIRQNARDAGRPEPELDPSRSMRGEFELGHQLDEIRAEIRTGERVIVDTRGLNAADKAALVEAVANEGFGGDVIFYP
ncbi:MAG: DUF4157 domain-containing protein [Myxococcales bacterium]|nr:DUF4157 domain-containing protein [Myxococcales bacterium]